MAVTIQHDNTLDSRGMIIRYRKYSRNATQRLRLLETDWPLALDMVMRTFDSVGDYLEITGESPLMKGLTEALEEYEKALNLPDVDRLTVFTDAYFQQLIGTIGTLCLRSNTDQWVLEDPRPMSHFLKKNERITVARRLPPKDLYAKLCEKFLDGAMKSLIHIGDDRCE